jgi:exonuclease SbcC
MINSIQIHNYQTHKDTKINLSKGVNVITGESSQGKTALLRALIWALTNKPSKGKPSWWDKNSSNVVVEFTDKTIIQRGRKKNLNYYKSSLINNDLTAFGQNVPDEIKQIVCMNDVNIHKQFDTPFLLSSTAGDVAKLLNKIVNLEIIDSSLFKANQKKRKEKQQLEFVEQRKIELEKELNNFGWLDNAEKDLNKINNIQTRYDNINKEYNEIEDIINSLERMDEGLLEINKLLTIENEVNKIIKIQVKENDIDDKIADLINLLMDIETISTKIDTKEKQLIDMEKEHKKLMGNYCPFCKRRIKK